MTDWLQPPPIEAPPTHADVGDIWETVGVAPEPVPPPGVEALLAALRGTHVNGGAMFARFRVAPNPVLHWIAALNRWQDFGLLDSFVRSTPVREALPELRVGGRLRAKPAWTEESAFGLAGEVARELVVGGAYRQFRGPATQARAIGDGFCAALFDDRLDEVQLFQTFTPWAPWFYDVAWDRTWLMIDRRERAISMLCITDTD